MKHCSPYTPTTTGAVERFNQSLLRKIRRITEFGKKKWKDHLAQPTDAYNKSWNRSINCSPVELIIGEVKFKIDKEFGVVSRSSIDQISKRALESLHKYRLKYDREESGGSKN